MLQVAAVPKFVPPVAIYSKMGSDGLKVAEFRDSDGRLYRTWLGEVSGFHNILSRRF